MKVWHWLLIGLAVFGLGWWWYKKSQGTKMEAVRAAKKEKNDGNKGTDSPQSVSDSN